LEVEAAARDFTNEPAIIRTQRLTNLGGPKFALALPVAAHSHRLLAFMAQRIALTHTLMSRASLEAFGPPRRNFFPILKGVPLHLGIVYAFASVRR
jgi:hypothetical protein